MRQGGARRLENGVVVVKHDQLVMASAPIGGRTSSGSNAAGSGSSRIVADRRGGIAAGSRREKRPPMRFWLDTTFEGKRRVCGASWPRARYSAGSQVGARLIGAGHARCRSAAMRCARVAYAGSKNGVVVAKA
jgi:hypothetical protein